MNGSQLPNPGPAGATALELTRRHFLSRTATGIGVGALGSLLADDAAASSGRSGPPAGALRFPPRAKRVIYLYMAGGPSQFESFDNKPLLGERHGEPLPESLTSGVKLAFLQNSELRCFGAQAGFKKCGESGAEVSDYFPHLQSIADELCIVRTLQTEQVNHDPAHTFMNTGSAIVGRPSMGAWLTYGLGSENRDLPGFVVMRSGPDGQPISTVNWHSGFLPSRHQGVQFYSKGTPLHYIESPPGVSAEVQKSTIDAVNHLNRVHGQQTLDPEVQARIAQYELAFRMQTSVPALADWSGEPRHVLEAYGVEDPDAGPDGGFAANCVMARRLVERGTRFVQLYHTGWDHHGGIKKGMAERSREVDQPAAALIRDLQQRGLLDDTLVVWGGEFGRTPMAQGSGRDHHTKSGAMFLCGGGVKRGVVYGETDPFGFAAVDEPFHVHDFHATVLHLLGIDHERLTYRHQGRNFRLTDVHGELVEGILA